MFISGRVCRSARVAVAGALLLLPRLSLSAVPQGSEIQAPGPLGPLVGTFVDAGSRTPVVLMVPGSGPTDRNGNSALGPHPATLRQIATGLAERNISSVRIDKRGMFGSRQAIADANQVTIADYVSDVRRWVGIIRARTGTPCVWLAGHSEGGLVALASVQSVPSLCGLILLSTGGRRFGEILRGQLHAIPSAAPVLPQIDGAIDRLEAGERVDVNALHPGLRSLFRPAVQGYMIDIMRYDPVALLKATSLPVLILQGEADKQVSATQDFTLLKAADPSASALLVPKASHALSNIDAPPGQDGSAPLDAEVVPAIADFVFKKGSRNIHAL